MLKRLIALCKRSDILDLEIVRACYWISRASKNEDPTVLLSQVPAATAARLISAAQAVVADFRPEELGVSLTSGFAADFSDKDHWIHRQYVERLAHAARP